MDSPYEVLEVDPDADESAVVRAYRRRVKETHPDRGGSAAAFKRVQAAYARIQNGADPAANGAPAAANGPGAGTSTAAGPASNGSEPSAEEQGAARVEFLDYEVLASRGWDVGDDDLFERAAAADLGSEEYGRLLVQPDETILEAAQNRGYSWPFSCRGGACANCAIVVVEGEVEMPSNHVLNGAWLDRSVRLSCIATPVSDDLKVLFNVKTLPGLDELRLPPQQFER